MKTTRFYAAILAGAALVLSSCERELMGYEGEEGVYFAVQHGASYGSEWTWPYQPYSNVEFIRETGDTVTKQFKVMATGPVKDYDRVFRVAINLDSTTARQGVDYELPGEDFVISANSSVGYVSILLKRTPGLQDSVKKIGLRLVENSFFSLAFPEWDAVPGLNSGTIVAKFDASLHTINMNDFIVQPPVWTGSIQAGGREAGMWGAFSRKKLEMMCVRFSLTYNDFLNTTTMPTVLQGLIATTMSNDLIELYNQHTPVLEDDGRLMFFWECPWTSYIGVPWVPEF
ncbi:MAG: DUF4843 domain-containing protein [Odoribacteraceae bacterium]|jgi:hypothetical protein|nr:DUF4843 domain-containing protein [Odoribacteraceae bacterium]